VRPVEQVNVLGVGVHPTNPQNAVLTLRDCIQDERKGYVCLIGVHGVMEAQRDHSLKSIFSESLLVAPDGMPTVWMGHLQGFSTMRRVYGPDLMLDVFSKAEFHNCSHFFCGGEPGVAERLQEAMLRKFPRANITGTFSPPFRPMTPKEEKAFAAKVNSLKPDIIWVGLSTPKQERFMAHYLPMLDTKLMVGVGAAFLFHTGSIRDSPQWVKRAGLQWLHRLLQEPTRLWRRYLLNNPIFIFNALLQTIGLKYYALNPIAERYRRTFATYSDDPKQ
jgi:N-acetylglucosaminyldiphosphoundecaprenol N-acetyl-beta-D-mannosaminyltransferase